MGGSDRHDDNTATGDRVAAAVEELYGTDPQAFTGRRGELVAAAQADGDRAAAKAIRALRRPTRAAWVVNQLARADPSVAAGLAELASALSAAQQARHGPRLRELSAARGALIDVLTAQALAVASMPDPPPALRLEIAETLAAALADPEVAADFAAGTLTRAAQWSGFGVLPPDAGDAAGEDAADAGGTTLHGTAGPGAVRAPERAEDGDGGHDPLGGRQGGDRPGGTPSRAARSGAAPGGRGLRGGARGAGAGSPDAALEAAARRQAEEAEREAREAREAQAAAAREARRREQYEDAERVVADASTAAAEAGAAEDRLEGEVRDLEQRLTRARGELATARLRARHAEAAERRARQVLDRLPRDPPAP